MKIERLRKIHKKKIVVGGLILISVVSAITLVTTRAKYRITQDIKLVSGTVNYKPYDFKIMAMYKSEDGTNYTEINEMPTSGYTVNEEKSYCTTDNKTQVKEKIKTINGNHIISNLKKSDKCYIWFDKKPITSSDIIAAVNPKATTPNFANAATTDEGVYSASDGMYGGTAYYWRGAVTNNYIIFANLCWRIVRINGDGSIRLIYDGTVCRANGESTIGEVAVTEQAYNSPSDRNEYAGWTYILGSQRPTDNGTATASNIKSQTETWYNNITGTNAEKVADGKFCNDRSLASGETWSSQPSSMYYAGYDRVKDANSAAPTLSCNNAGDIYELKAGAITMDEVVMAGGKWGTANSSYYLYNGQNYWTMSPVRYYWWTGTGSVIAFYVSSDGQLSSQYASNTYGVRPVINLKADTTFATGGNGTQNNPYIVE